MREIKFKAWNRANNTMQPHIISIENWSFSFLDQELFIWLQFTGLKDKNGKDIYEGDILCSPHYPSNGSWHYLYHEVKWDNDYTGWKVVSVGNPEGESIKAHGNPQLWVYIKNEKEFEIIGNIYENPDLLNSKEEENPNQQRIIEGL